MKGIGVKFQAAWVILGWIYWFTLIYQKWDASLRQDTIKHIGLWLFAWLIFHVIPVVFWRVATRKQ